MAEAKETICTHCDHLWVCKYKEELLSKVTEIDKTMKNSRFSYVISCPDCLRTKEEINPMKAVKTKELPIK